jgi:small subunit ribosomal protein S12
MSSYNQIVKKPRKQKQKLLRAVKLQCNPFKKAICLKVLTISPKKPNSANRAIAKLLLTHHKSRLIAKIPGEKHNLQVHSSVIVKGARVRDLIGVGYSLVRGKLDLQYVQNRKTRRSLFGVKKL